MKKYILPILISSLLLSACSLWNKEEIFERKTDCLEMKNDMFKFAKTLKPQVWQIDEIFYSKSKNSCFFVTRETRDIDQGVTRDFATLFDYLNQKMLLEAPLSN